MSAKKPAKRPAKKGGRPAARSAGGSSSAAAAAKRAAERRAAARRGEAGAGGATTDDGTVNGTSGEADEPIPTGPSGGTAADAVDADVAALDDEPVADEPPVDEPVDEADGDLPAASPAPVVASRRSLAGKLYHGETNVDFVGRRRIWFSLSAALVLVGVVALFANGLNLGIDFEGGVVWQTPAGDASVADARSTIDEFGLGGSTIQELESDDGRVIRVEAEPVPAGESDRVTAALAELTGSETDDVDLRSVGPTWGDQISRKAVRALVVFLVVVTLYITLRFELKMAIATLVALVHDVLITVGFYAVTRVEVTPATVVAVLTILGYSIYDGIVVFDKVDENTRRVSSNGGLSYAGMVNVSLNQALMRSLNTTVTALLPVLSLLVVGSGLLGAATLEEFAIALLIGLFSGAYSSLFLASPVLAVLKEREPRYRAIRDRIAARGGDRDVVAATIAAGGRPIRGGNRIAPTGTDRDASAPTISASGRVIPARPRKKSKSRR